MLDIGWSELLLIGVAALIVIGPEELPRMFHNLGRMTARARQMAREFSSAMEDAAKSSGLDDVKKDLDGLRGLTSKKNLGLDALDRATERFEKWEPKFPTPGKPAPQPDPAMGRPSVPPAAPAAAPAEAGDEVVTFRTAPTAPAAAPAATGTAPTPAKPVRRTAAKTRKAEKPAATDGTGTPDA